MNLRVPAPVRAFRFVTRPEPDMIGRVRANGGLGSPNRPEMRKLC